MEEKINPSDNNCNSSENFGSKSERVKLDTLKLQECNEMFLNGIRWPIVTQSRAHIIESLKRRYESKNWDNYSDQKIDCLIETETKTQKQIEQSELERYLKDCKTLGIKPAEIEANKQYLEELQYREATFQSQTYVIL